MSDNDKPDVIDRFLPDGRRLVLDHPNHAYALAGVELAGLTRIIATHPDAPDFDAAGVDPEVVWRAGQRGRYVDACCDLMLDGRLDEDAVHPECVPYVRGWKHYMEKQRYSRHYSQVLAVNPEGRYFTYIDSVLTSETFVPVVVERKCTSKVSSTHGMQLIAVVSPGTLWWIDGEWKPAPMADLDLVHLRKDKPARILSIQDSKVVQQAWHQFVREYWAKRANQAA